MRKIFKYEASVQDEIKINVPSGSEILKVACVQPHRLTFWVLVDPTEKLITPYYFEVRGTGPPIDLGRNSDNETKEIKHKYFDTVFDGLFVWHLFRA